MKRILPFAVLMSALLAPKSRAVAATPPHGKLQFFSSGDARKTLPLRENQTLRKIALSQMPRGGISNFFGALKGSFAKRGSADAYLVANLYALPMKNATKARREYSLLLDMFAYSRKTARLTRLQRIDLTKKLKCINGDWSQGNDSANAMDLLWIDAKRRQTPMLRLQMSGTVMSGIAGCFGLVIFRDGWRAAPVVQDFETYDNITARQNLLFNTRNKGGFLVLRQENVGYDMNFDKPKPMTETPPSHTYFDWNGRRFIARKTQTPSLKSR